MYLHKQISAAAPPFIRLPQRRQRPSTSGAALAAQRLPIPSGHALPTLDAALDGRQMSAYLRSKLPLLAQAHNMSVSSAQLLDCKAGKRALVRYELTAPGQRAKVVIFGKIYSQLEQLMRVDQILESIWCDDLGGPNACSTPQPLGVIPELSMLLYLPAEGEFLDTMLAGKEAAQAIQLTARWLGAFHCHPLQVDKHFDLANELTNLAAWAALVGQSFPEMAALAHSLLGYVQQQAQLITLDATTPIHKDFHYRHVLVGGSVKVIDLDEVRLGDANFDLAHFCANLRLLSYRQQGAPHHLHALEREFLHSYVQRTGQSWPTFARANRARFRFFYVYTCLKIARQLCLGVGPSPAPVGDERRRQVQMILKQGERVL